MTEDDVNPMNPAWRTALEAANVTPRCTARSKRTGRPCQAPAVTGWRVCRFHGAGGGHAAGPSHPSWQHGMRAQDWIEERRHLNHLVREARKIERLMGVAALGPPSVAQGLAGLSSTALLCPVGLQGHGALVRLFPL
jgi:hypothetical protein